MRCEKVSIVGCGVVSLIIAYYLVESGYEVEMFDKISDPRNTGQNCIISSATFAGEDARIFSLNEARHHNFGRHCPKTKVNTQFRRYFHEDGWMGMPLKNLSNHDRDWISNFELVSKEEGKEYDRDIISFNQESALLWKTLKVAIPHIFKDGNLVEGLIRVYQSNDAFITGIKQELSIDSIGQVLECSALKLDYPIFSNAIDAGKIKQAAYVQGFSVNCQSFCRSLISYLEICEVKFHWESSIECIKRSRDGRISGLISKSKIYKSQHYIISTGFSGYHLLYGFDSDGLVAPVYGMWLRLPLLNNEKFLPTKISRSGFASPGAAEGANVIPGYDENGNPVLFISSGHGYMGIGQTKPNDSWARELKKAVIETAQDIFPEQYNYAMEHDLLEDSLKYCVRPWTPSGLGIFEVKRTTMGGSCCVVGGNSTGGFAQSPSIAQAVLSALANQEHLMHELYHPHRVFRVQSTANEATIS